MLLLFEYEAGHRTRYFRSPGEAPCGPQCRSQKGRERRRRRRLGKGVAEVPLPTQARGQQRHPSRGITPFTVRVQTLSRGMSPNPGRQATCAKCTRRETGLQRRSVRTRSHHGQARPRRSPELSNPYSNVEMNNSKANSRNSTDQE